MESIKKVVNNSKTIYHAFGCISLDFNMLVKSA